MVWFALSLGVTVYFGVQSLDYAFSRDYLIQDDARQHVFWMLRFLDPNLFPNDIIADYFQSVAPTGYKLFYRFFTLWGIDPLWLSKVLPLGLGLIATGYGFAATLQILPVPAAGFAASLLLDQTLWLEDDLVSATPRAFVYPLFFAFLYYGLRGSMVPIWITIALQALFYPQIALVSLAIVTLKLLDWQKPSQFWSSNRRDYWIWGGAMAIAFVTLLPYQISPNEFGEIIAASEARTQPEFNAIADGFGRGFFFHDNPFIFWLFGPRSGFLFLGLMTPLNLLALALPVLLKQGDRFPLSQKVSPDVRILLQAFLAATALFFVAHLLIFKLHFPNRYVYHTLRSIMPIAAGIAIVIWSNRWFKVTSQNLPSSRQKIGLLVAAFLGGILAIAPFSEDLTISNQLYVKGRAEELYEFLQKQPKDTLIASFSREGDNLPTFARRSTFVGREYALPYHVKYYTKIRQRAVDLLDAHYSPDIQILRELIQNYGIDFLLVDRNAFTVNYIKDRTWLRQYKMASKQAIANLESGETPALATFMQRCRVLGTERSVLLDANCIQRESF